MSRPYRSLLICWLLRALRGRVYEHIGCVSVFDYAEWLFGYKPRFVGERLRVAEVLEELPKTAAALGTGRLCWSAARELTRVATPQNEGRWLEATRGKTVRQIEEMVAGRQRGDEPDDPADPRARRHVLRFEG